MHYRITRKINDIYRKNKDDFRALLLGLYPSFIYRNITEINDQHIPIFALHSVTPARFESQLAYLAENNYKTLNADELVAVLTSKKKAEVNTIVLTFDDGWGSLWSVAYPLLKKYGFKAIAFLVPRAIPDEDVLHSNLEDYWSGKADLSEIITREKTSVLCNWKELKVIHNSNVIDFQSHTSGHSSLYTSNKIIDFVRPSYIPTFLFSNFCPVVKKSGLDVFLSAPDFGRPIYARGAFIASELRYIEDEGLSEHCINFVKQNGGKSFFLNKNWRQILKKITREYRSLNGEKGRTQTADERFRDIFSDLSKSKQAIEQKFDKNVSHLCYPWYEGSELSVTASKEAGYSSNHWGILHKRVVNKVGDNPFFITRMNDDYIFSLPGKNRMSIYEILNDKVRRLAKK